MKYDFEQMRTAFTGSVPVVGDANPYTGEVCFYMHHPWGGCAAYLDRIL